MRTREEINDVVEQASSLEVREIKLQRGILEVLLDIRDLLNREA